MKNLKLYKLMLALILSSGCINNISPMEEQIAKNCQVNTEGRNAIQYFKQKGIEKPSPTDLNIVANHLLYQKANVMTLEHIRHMGKLVKPIEGQEFTKQDQEFTNLINEKLEALDSKKAACSKPYAR